MEIKKHPAANGGKWIRPDKRLSINLRDQFTCLYCGRNMHDAEPRDVTLDHLVAVSKGGGNGQSNLITACRRCNSSRGNKDWEDFAPGGAQDRIIQQIHKPIPRALAKAILDGTVGDREVEAERSSG